MGDLIYLTDYLSTRKENNKKIIEQEDQGARVRQMSEYTEESLQHQEDGHNYSLAF